MSPQLLIVIVILTCQGLDIQLKILQTLPALLQHYSDDLGGELLVSTLEICATLQTSKTLALSSTAAATLQQLVVSTFERVTNEDSTLPRLSFGVVSRLVADTDTETLDESQPTVTVKVDSNPIKIGYFAYDALRVRLESGVRISNMLTS